MKYKIGDKVRYDGGDWWFYGTVSAVFEHSICPCYRLSVERMEKKTCKFSITQFEFELEADFERDKDKRKWENSEIEDLKKYHDVPNNAELPQIQKPRIQKTTDAWEKNLYLYQQGKKSGVLNVWKSKNRKDYKTGILSKDKYEKLMEINFPFVVDKKYKPTTGKTKPEKVEWIPIQTKKPTKRKTSEISEIWERNLDDYLKGTKSYAIYNWITNNRKQHQTGRLSEEKYEKLMGINFPFVRAGKKVEQKQKIETPKRKRGDEWEINFELYRKGEKSDTISSWIANNRREFKTGKLIEAKYEKLLGINFPFDVGQKKDDNWEKQLEEWKKGERRSKPIQQWKQRSLKQYSEDKLSVDRILKLKEVGILS